MFNISTLVNIVQGIGLIIVILIGSMIGLVLIYGVASAAIDFIKDVIKEVFK